jgi:hypothetical protein
MDGDIRESEQGNIQAATDGLDISVGKALCMQMQ